MATAATRRENENPCSMKPMKNRLDSDRPSHGRPLHSNFDLFRLTFTSESFDRFSRRRSYKGFSQTTRHSLQVSRCRLLRRDRPAQLLPHHLFHIANLFSPQIQLTRQPLNLN